MTKKAPYKESGRPTVTVVVISSDGEGDRSVESLEVKVPVAAGKAANLEGERPFVVNYPNSDG